MAALYLDHNVAAEVARLLQEAGHEASTARQLGIDRVEDDEMPRRAAEARRILVSHNLDDFELLHCAWLRWSRWWGLSDSYAGILLVPQTRPFPPARLARELSTYPGRGLPLENELHRLTSAGIWQRRSLDQGWLAAG